MRLKNKKKFENMSKQDESDPTAEKIGKLRQKKLRKE
jgi:hypothetical protein